MVRAETSGMVAYKPDYSGLRVKVETVNAMYFVRCLKKKRTTREDG